jgi:hypothetical protein
VPVERASRRFLEFLAAHYTESARNRILFGGGRLKLEGVKARYRSVAVPALHEYRDPLKASNRSKLG